jgi:hypothetical protein
VADLTSGHERHDIELVAAYAIGDVEGLEADRAKRLVQTCGECAALADDIRSIRSAVQSSRVTAEARATRAPRDFRLTAADAARLRPVSPLARMRDRIAGAFGAYGRPVGATLASFGVVGLLVGSVNLGGQAASAPAAPAAAATGVGANEAGPATEASAGPGSSAAGDFAFSGQASGSPQSTITRTSTLGPADSGQPQAEGGVGGKDAAQGPTTPDATPPAQRLGSMLLSGSMLLLVLGLGLIALAPRARRRAR